MIIKIHITLILILIYNIFVGKIDLIFIAYLFIIMHELAHMIMAILLNIDIYEIDLMPFGVSAKYKEKATPIKEFFISIIGPLMSIFLSIIYNNKLYCGINICIAIFNLLPIYPLDGGRILRVILKYIFGDKISSSLISYITNILIIGLILFSLFMAAYFRNFFFLAISLYMFRISKEEIQKENIMKAINYLQIDK